LQSVKETKHLEYWVITVQGRTKTSAGLGLRMEALRIWGCSCGVPLREGLIFFEVFGSRNAYFGAFSGPYDEDRPNNMRTF